MGLEIEGEYYSKSRDAGPYVPPSFPSDRYKENYDLIQWDKPLTEEEKDGRRRNQSRSKSGDGATR
ncbi:MAG: hypothetical protein ACW987_20250 [Candidatus Thorarchaeota archaeon]|jgi:hypothetical protein